MQNDKFESQPPPTAPQPGYPADNAPNYGGTQVHPVPTIVPEPTGFWKGNQQNTPQSKAVAAEWLIFASGGMNIGFSIQVWSFVFKTHMRVSWFVGAMIGALLTSLLVNKIPRKPLVQFASVLVIIGGIVMSATRYNVDAIIASRYLDGIANGLVLAPMLAFTGEGAVKGIRGTVASSEQMFFSLGIFIELALINLWGLYSSFTAIQMQGVLSIVFGLIALILATFLTVESPVSLLAKGQEQQAIDVLRRLQKPNVLSTQTYQQLDDHKRYLAENRELSFGQSISQGLPALIRLCLLRTLNTMSISYIVYLSLFLSATLGYHTFAAWPFIIFGALRYIGSWISMFIMDLLGRKKIVLFGGLLCGGMAVGFAAVFKDINYRYSTSETLVFLFIFTFFAGFASTSSSVYLTEAFPLAVKPYFIAAAFMVEMLVHIIISCCDYTVDGAVVYFYILGAAWILYFLLGIWCLPETKQTTLREAQQKFKGFISKGF